MEIQKLNRIKMYATVVLQTLCLREELDSRNKKIVRVTAAQVKFVV